MIVYDTDIKCFNGYRNAAQVQMGGNCLTGVKFPKFNNHLTRWTHTSDPTSYNLNNDDWNIVNDLPSITTLAGNFRCM